MKKSALIIVIFLAVSVTSAANLVVNPGFETSESERVPKSWTVV